MSVAFKGTRSVEVPVGGGEEIGPGNGIVIDASGYAAEPSVATGLKTVGNCLHKGVDNSAGADGDKDVVAHRGPELAFPYANSAAADEITKENIGEPCYWAGAAQVALTDGTNTRSAAGVIADVVDDGTVYVVHPIQAL